MKHFCEMGMVESAEVLLAGKINGQKVDPETRLCSLAKLEPMLADNLRLDKKVLGEMERDPSCCADGTTEAWRKDTEKLESIIKRIGREIGKR